MQHSGIAVGVTRLGQVALQSAPASTYCTSSHLRVRCKWLGGGWIVYYLSAPLLAPSRYAHR
jgi:hypothetical protein